MGKKLRKKISNDLKKKAKDLFECGMDMVDISIELQINLQTLYNMSSKENWEKGKKKELLGMLESEDKLKKLIEIRENVITEYSEIEQENRKILKELQLERNNKGNRKLVKSKSEAASLIMKSASEGFRMAKELYNILTPIEVIELNKKKIEYEKLKKKFGEEIESGDIEY